MMVVTGTAGPVVIGAALVPVRVLETAATVAGGGRMTVGMRVMVEGMAVTIPGFWGTQLAQIPVKYERADWISPLDAPQA